MERFEEISAGGCQQKSARDCNLDDLRTLVQGLSREGVRVEFVKESLVHRRGLPHGQPHALHHGGLRGIRTLSDQGTSKERHRPGQTARRLQGRKNTLTPERTAELVQRVGNGVPKAVLARDYGISRETAYQDLRHAKLK
jgi:DNA invertase Pin-like site-specific DNA recombinase